MQALPMATQGRPALSTSGGKGVKNILVQLSCGQPARQLSQFTTMVVNMHGQTA